MVHGECDDVIDEAMLAARPEEQPEYQCRICRNMDPEVPDSLTVNDYSLSLVLRLTDEQGPCS